MGKKVWLNNKYIKIKKNKKLKSKFFGPFQIIYAVEKSTYKLELPIKCKIHDIFYMLLLKQDTIRKKQVDKVLVELKKDLKFEVRGNKEDEVKTIIYSGVYGQ